MALGNVVYTSDFPWNFSLLPVPIGVLSFGKDLPVFQPSLMHHSSCLHPPETKQSIGHQLAFKLLEIIFSVANYLVKNHVVNINEYSSL